MPFTTKIRPYAVLLVKEISLVVAAISLAAFVQFQEPRRNPFKAVHAQLCGRGNRSLSFVCEEKLWCYTRMVQINVSLSNWKSIRHFCQFIESIIFIFLS